MIKKFLLSALMTSFVVGLSGCGPVYQTNYHYVAPKSWRGKQCVNRCLSTRSRCHSRCNRQNQSCRNDANLAAMPAYLEYVSQQKKANLPATQSVTDFADYSQCYDSCSCESNYHECYRNCGGKVTAHTVCVANCKQQP